MTNALPQKQDDERVAIPLDTEDALRGLLSVEPEAITDQCQVHDSEGRRCLLRVGHSVPHKFT